MPGRCTRLTATPMERFVEQLSNYIHSIQNDAFSINQDASVAQINEFNAQLQGLVELLQNQIQASSKQTRALLNCDQNPQMFAQLVRILLLIQYQSVVSCTMQLIGVLSFPKSTVPAKMVENGALTLVAYHLEDKQGQLFLHYLQQLHPLFDNHCASVNISLIQAVCAQLSSLQDEVRHAVYQTIQLLLVRQTEHYQLIYDAIIKQSIQPDMWDDIIFVVNIMGLFYQEPLYRRYLIHDTKLTQKLNVFLPKEEVSEVQVQVAEKKSEHEKPELLFKQLQDMQQRIKLLEIGIDTSQKQEEEIERIQQLKEQEFGMLKSQMEEDKRQMLESQAMVNTNKAIDTELKLNYLTNYQIQQSQFQISEQACQQCQQEINNLKKKSELKRQELGGFIAQRVRMLEQITQLEQKIELVKKGEYKKEDAAEPQEVAKPNYDFRVSQGVKGDPQLEYMKDFVACMSKNIDCLAYLCEHKYGLSYLFTQLSDSTECKQLMAFYGLLNDLLLCNEMFRDLINDLVFQTRRCASEKQVLNPWFGCAQDSILTTASISIPCDPSTRTNLRWIIQNATNLERMRDSIVTSFNGNATGPNVSTTFQSVALQKYLQCGIIEFLVLQSQILKDEYKSMSLYYMAQTRLLLQVMTPQIYQQFEKRFQLMGGQLPENIYLNNSMLKRKFSTLYQSSIVEGNAQQYKQYFEAIAHFSNELNQHSTLVSYDAAATFVTWRQYLVDSHVMDYENPVRWNWERVNDMLQLQKYERRIKYTDAGKGFMEKVIRFIDGSLLTGKPMGPGQQYVLYDPVTHDPAAPCDIYTAAFAASHIFNSLFDMPKCPKTVRISQICYNLVHQIISDESCLRVIEKSRFGLRVKDVLYQLTHQTGDDTSLRETVFSYIGLLARYVEGIEYLQQQEIWSLLPKLLYDERFPTYQKLLVASLPVSCQFSSIRRGEQCACGQLCRVTTRFNDEIRILIMSALSADVASRYCVAYQFGMLLKSRRHALTKKPARQTCTCICEGCLPQPIPFAYVLNEEGEHWILDCLKALINDTQPEVAMLALMILEEFLTPGHVDIYQTLNMDNWPNYGGFLSAKFLGLDKFAEKLSLEDVKQVYDPIQIYRYFHNIEQMQFLAANRFVSRRLRDVMFDKAVPPQKQARDSCYGLIEHYAFDFLALPHQTQSGRASLRFPEMKDSYSKLQKIFTIVRSTEPSVILPKTLTHTQLYLRSPKFVELAKSAVGRAKIIQTGILVQLIQKLFQLKDRTRTSYRGSMFCLAALVEYQDIFNALCQHFCMQADLGAAASGISVFRLIHNLVLYCESAKTKQYAVLAISMMVKNPALKAYYESIGWSFCTTTMRDRVGISPSLEPQDAFRLFHSSLDLPTDAVASLLDGSVPSVGCFAAKFSRSDNVFSLNRSLHSSLFQYFNPDLVPTSECKKFFAQRYKQPSSQWSELPPLTEYNIFHRAVTGFNEERGVYCISLEEYDAYLEKYRFTQLYEPLEKIREERGASFCKTVEAYIKNIPLIHFEFTGFMQRSAYQENDLGFYDAMRFITSNDQFDKQQGIALLLEAKNKSLQGGPTLSAFALYVLAAEELPLDIRFLIGRLVHLSPSLLDVLDQLAACEQCVYKEGFM